MRRNRSIALCAFVALLPSCRDGEAQPAAIDADNPIELAAREANLVDDPDNSVPVGLFERRHSSGRDALCVAPGDSSDYRFGLIASFGATLMCQGQGAATQDGDRLRLDFDEVDCQVEAVYDGRTVRFPGVVPQGCAALCGPRASISGVAVTRVGWSEGDAASLKSRAAEGRGQPLCPVSG